MKREKLETTNFCECGCGQIAKPGSRFIRGHNSKGVKGQIPWNKGITKKDDPRIRGGLQIEKIVVACDACGKELERHPCHVKRNRDRHNFCDRDCQTAFQKKPRKQRSYKKRLALVLDPNVKCFWCEKPANFIFSTGKPCCESRPFRCSGCSTHSGPENGMFGKNHTEESKCLMSENNGSRRPEVRRKFSIARTGVKLSPEHCKAISEGKKGLYTGPDNPMYGKKRSEEFKEAKRKFMLENNPMNYIDFAREKNPFFGKTHTRESRDVMSAKTSMEKHPRWRGGISFEPYGIEFNNQLREEIRERDGHVCQFCGRTSKQNMKDFGCMLHIHHIDYDKNKTIKSNLITLCKSCHSHTYTNREFWQDLYEDLMRKKQREEVVNL